MIVYLYSRVYSIHPATLDYGFVLSDNQDLWFIGVLGLLMSTLGLDRHYSSSQSQLVSVSELTLQKKISELVSKLKSCIAHTCGLCAVYIVWFFKTCFIPSHPYDWLSIFLSMFQIFMKICSTTWPLGFLCTF